MVVTKKLIEQYLTGFKVLFINEYKNKTMNTDIITYPDGTGFERNAKYKSTGNKYQYIFLLFFIAINKL